MFWMLIVEQKNRTLCAGLKKHYKPEELKGKKVIIVFNLDEKEFKGIKSKGMVVAEALKKSTKLLFPDQEIKEGTDFIPFNHKLEGNNVNFKN